MKNRTVITAALGTALIAGTAFAPLASAADNPFGAQLLKGGYQLAAADTKAADGKCGEAKCGADKAKAAPMGDKMGSTVMEDKKADGSCGADKKRDGSCGADKK